MLRTVHAKYRQGAGKIRRLLLAQFRQRYIDHQLTKRRGECIRCGACCRLLFKCPFLQTHKNGATSCRIHKHRTQNCQIFPINEKDLHDRNLCQPEIACGFYFD